MKEQCKITVVDCPPGAGKTSYAIKYMKEEIFDRFIFITPFLTELDRIEKECDNREFKKPNERLGKGSKKNHFYELLKEGYNIVSTHSLFKGISKEVIDEIEKGEYILFLDEVFDVIEDLHISKSDISMLLEHGTIEVDSEDKVHWIDSNYTGKFTSLKNSCENGDVYLFENTMILWTFPVNIFKAFKHIYILTYKFKSQIQAYYYDMNQVEYEYKSVTDIGDRQYRLTNYKEEGGNKYKDLINIYDGKLNNIGDKTTALSKSWYMKADKKRNNEGT